jgi:hypothetical protein
MKNIFEEYLKLLNAVQKAKDRQSFVILRLCIKDLAT